MIMNIRVQNKRKINKQFKKLLFLYVKLAIIVAHSIPFNSVFFLFLKTYPFNFQNISHFLPQISSLFLFVFVNEMCPHKSLNLG